MAITVARRKTRAPFDDFYCLRMALIQCCCVGYAFAAPGKCSAHLKLNTGILHGLFFQERHFVIMLGGSTDWKQWPRSTSANGRKIGTHSPASHSFTHWKIATHKAYQGAQIEVQAESRKKNSKSWWVAQIQRTDHRIRTSRRGGAQPSLHASRKTRRGHQKCHLAPSLSHKILQNHR